MAKDKHKPCQEPEVEIPETGAGFSRRDLLTSAATGAALGTIAAAGLSGAITPSPAQAQSPAGQRILLKGGVVLTLDPDGDDLPQGDVLIQGSKIVAIGPNLAAGGQVIDCRGKIVMPGFINTHYHQYYVLPRAVFADGRHYGGVAQINWPTTVDQYFTVGVGIWTNGLLPGVWDLGKPPMEPEDLYIAELVASWGQTSAGVTTGVDLSQSSHTPEHTDAMIQGLMDSGRRTLYGYTSSTRPDQPGYEFPGAIGDETSGIGRLRKEWFSSNDQLVTLGAQFPSPNLWPLARHYEAPMVFHGNAAAVVNDPSLGGPDLCVVHGVGSGVILPSEQWQIMADTGMHISIAGPIEMAMGHGTPPYQEALDHNILPSLSSDIDLNMTADSFTQMRQAFTFQRVLAQPTNPYIHAGKPLVNCRTVMEMATIAGAAACGLSSKVGMLKVGMEADVIVLKARTIDTAPIMNAHGAVVTLMDRSHVDTVIIAGKIKKLRGQLMGVNEEQLIREIERAQERVLDRIQSVPLPDSPFTAPGYTPSLVRSCCNVEHPYPNANP